MKTPDSKHERPVGKAELERDLSLAGVFDLEPEPPPGYYPFVQIMSFPPNPQRIQDES